MRFQSIHYGALALILSLLSTWGVSELRREPLPVSQVMRVSWR